MLVPRIGRNFPCICGSGKKYKNCCLSSIQADVERNNQYIPSAKMTNAIMYLNEAFPDYKFEDITPKLRTYTYKVYQHQNYDNTSKILIAERNEVTEEVFKTRDMGNLDYDIIIMRHGAYRVFNSALIQNFHNSIKVFITERF